MTSQINQIGGQYIQVPREAYELVLKVIGDSRELTGFFEAVADECTPRIDNKKRYYGTDKDSSDYFDGTNRIINPKESGAGILSILGAFGGQELSADPADPAEGEYVIWQSDGTGTGDDGDIMVKITAGGSTKTTTLIDFSTL